MVLVLIESRLWARYTMHDGKISLAPHVPGPTAGDVTILTGEACLVVSDESSSATVQAALHRAFDR
jgi:hypothetical protein